MAVVGVRWRRESQSHQHHAALGNLYLHDTDLGSAYASRMFMQLPEEMTSCFSPPARTSTRTSDGAKISFCAPKRREVWGERGREGVREGNDQQWRGRVSGRSPGVHPFILPCLHPVTPAVPWSREGSAGWLAGWLTCRKS